MKFEITIKKPWRPTRVWRPIWSWHASMPVPHKTFETELYYDQYDLLSFVINLSWRGKDHAGPQFSCGIAGYTFQAGIFDNRHWNYSEWCWEKHDEINK